MIWVSAPFFGARIVLNFQHWFAGVKEKRIDELAAAFIYFVALLSMLPLVVFGHFLEIAFGELIAPRNGVKLFPIFLGLLPTAALTFLGLIPSCLFVWRSLNEITPNAIAKTALIGLTIVVAIAPLT